jgi:hypothetical protein
MDKARKLSIIPSVLFDFGGHLLLSFAALNVSTLQVRILIQFINDLHK